MRTSLLSLVGLATTCVEGHYIFSHLVLNSEVTPEWKYVRDVVVEPGLSYEPNDIFGKIRPQEDINNEAMACGREAFASAGKTETANINAGAEVGFHVSKSLEGHSFYQIFHNGPAQAYLARAPNDDLQNFNGTEGKWFKVASITTAHDTTPNPDYWITYKQKQVNFTIPKLTPSGKYLLRFEQFMYPQWYVNCAHVNIISDSKVTVPENYPFATFPGTYKDSDPAINLDYKIWNKPGALLNYIGPGPPIWTGESAQKREVRFEG